MSPGNGYFKQEVIDKILEKALNEYEKIGIFIPDVPAISTYIALGYPENIARKEKAIPQGNSFRNRIARSLEAKGAGPDRVTVFDWRKENIETNPDYMAEYAIVKNLYKTSVDFRNDINDATSGVLVDNPFKKKEITAADIEIATHYILSEFAFVVFLPKYVSGHPNYVYVYHKPWPVFENFIVGFYDGVVRSQIRFLLFPDFS